MFPILAWACLACVCAALAAPVAMGAEEVSDPFSGTSNPSTQETTAAKTTNVTQTSNTSTAIPGTLVIVAVAAGALLLGGIAFVIVRDARSVAPVVEGGSGSGGSRSPEVRLRKRRAKAKAAKRQRKRNR